MPLLPAISVRWDISPQAAVAIQRELAGQVRIAPLARPVRYVAGADTSYNRGSNRVAGAVVVWDMEQQEVVEQRTAVVETPFPYVPGLLAWREAPALMPAFAALTTTPDVLVFNGHGIAHPRRLGLATHLGLVFGLPAMGVAAKKLCGTHDTVGDYAGDAVPLHLDGNLAGQVIRTKSGCNPIYVSPGHLMTVDDACQIVMATTLGYKLPAMIRKAHIVCNDVRYSFTLEAAVEMMASPPPSYTEQAP